MKLILLLVSTIMTRHVVGGVKQSRNRNRSLRAPADNHRNDRNGLYRRPGGRRPAHKGKVSFKKRDGDDDDDDDGGGLIFGPSATAGTGGDNGSSGGGGNICNDRVVTKTWGNIKLTAGNAITPFVGVEFAFGIGAIDLVVDSCTGQFEACATTDVQGFDVTTLQIARGKMSMNGPTVVDFSQQLGTPVPTFKGCARIPESLYLELVRNPDEFYLNASPGGVGERAIRGQLIQGFMMVPLANEQTVAPYNNVLPGASGLSSVTFENGGTTACFDSTIIGFDPLVAHLHFGQAGSNGPIFFDFSSVKADKGRFFGCISVADLGQTPLSVCELLADGYLYYFDFHLTNTDPGIFTTIRGQLPRLN